MHIRDAFQVTTGQTELKLGPPGAAAAAAEQEEASKAGGGGGGAGGGKVAGSVKFSKEGGAGKDPAAAAVADAGAANPVLMLVLTYLLAHLLTHLLTYLLTQAWPTPS